MCFSPSASFATSALLSLIGIKSMQKASPSRNMIAAIPFLFAIQQAAEGFVWLFLKNTVYTAWGTWAGYAYLFFAYFFWPMWIPLSLTKAEYNYSKKQYLKLISFIGILTSLFLLYLMISKGITIHNVHDHIYYAINISQAMNILTGIAYCVSTIIPFFISSLRHTKIAGTLIFITLCITYMVWYTYLTSIWCFFAALISMGVYLIV